MPSLYPEILFHFTDKQGLWGILADTFKISYSRECISGKNDKKRFAVPIVSFCDLRLSELREHMKKYGKYGIGMSKEWAISKGLNPVIYVSNGSHLISSFFPAIDKLYNITTATTDHNISTELANAYMSILHTLSYFKNYQGDLKRDFTPTISRYRFADEREWRYVPNPDGSFNPFLNIEKVKSSEDKKLENSKIAHLKLNFTPEDIKYLIVEKDDERIELIKHLEAVKGRFNEDIRRRLASRILTADQIEKDI